MCTAPERSSGFLRGWGRRYCGLLWKKASVQDKYSSLQFEILYWYTFNLIQQPCCDKPFSASIYFQILVIFFTWQKGRKSTFSSNMSASKCFLRHLHLHSVLKASQSIFRETKDARRTNRCCWSDSDVSARASAGFVCSYKRSSLSQTKNKANGEESKTGQEKKARQDNLISEQQLKLPFVFWKRNNDQLTAQSKHNAIDRECGHYCERWTKPNWLFQWHNFRGRRGKCNIMS